MIITGQKADILDYIADNGSITPMEAFDFLGITKLATRISELERYCGFEFNHDLVETVNVNGRKVRFCKYTLKNGPTVLEHDGSGKGTKMSLNKFKSFVRNLSYHILDAMASFCLCFDVDWDTDFGDDPVVIEMREKRAERQRRNIHEV